jgi:hypothetical protein
MPSSLAIDERKKYSYAQLALLLGRQSGGPYTSVAQKNDSPKKKIIMERYGR